MLGITGTEEGLRSQGTPAQMRSSGTRHAYGQGRQPGVAVLGGSVILHL